MAILNGLPEESLVDALLKFKSCYSLMTTFMRRESNMKNMFLSRCNFTTLSRKKETIVLVQPLSNGFYLKYGKDPSPSLELLRLREDRCCSRQENVFPNGVFQILWCESTPARVVFHANNATWGLFKFNLTQPSLPPVYTVWEDSIVSKVHWQFSSCSDCCLIVTIAKSVGDDRRLQCVFTELRNSPLQEVGHYSFVKNIPEELSDIDYLIVNKVYLCCHDSNSTTNIQGFCKTHLLFLQVRCAIIQYKVTKAVELNLSKYIVEPMRVLSAQDMGYSFRKAFVLSPDKQLMALTLDAGKFTLNTWQMKTGRNNSVVVPSVSDAVKISFMAVGTIYSVLVVHFDASYDAEKYLIVIRTHTGQLVVKCPLSLLVHFSCNEGWMSSLCCSEEPAVYKVIILDSSKGFQDTIQSQN